MFPDPYNKGLTKGRIEELLEKERELDEYRERELFKPIIDMFCRNLGLLASHTPYSQWTQREKVALNMAFEGLDKGMKASYIARLPQEEKDAN